MSKLFGVNGQIIVNSTSGKGYTLGSQYQTKTVTPSDTEQVVIPDSGYVGLSKVIVESGGDELVTIDGVKVSRDMDL